MRGRHGTRTSSHAAPSGVASDTSPARVSALLASARTSDLDVVLRTMGELLDVGRAYILPTRNGGSRLDNSYEWCAADASPGADELHGLSAEIFDCWMDRLRRGETICVRDVQDMPDEASAERDLLLARDIRSLLVVPLTAREGHLMGLMGFDDTRARRSWCPEDVRVLRVAAEMVARDLQRRQTEATLRHGEEYFRALIEDAPNLIMVLDAEGTARYLSPAYQDVLGYEPSSLVGRRITDLVHPEDRIAIEGELTALARTPGRIRSLEARVRHRDGSWRVLSGTVKNLLDVPAVGGLVVNSLDVTERQDAEQRLRLLSRAVEASPVSIVITDPRGAIVYTNPRFSETTGYSAEEALGRNPRLFHSGYTDPEVYNEMWETITAGREWHGELENRRKDGELYQEVVSISPVLGADGSVTHFVGVQEDVTERRLLQAKFEQAQRMQMVGRLVGGVAHDINNVLTAIGGYADFVLEALPDEHDLRSDVEEIARARTRAAGIVGQLLDFSRQNAAEAEVIDLNQVACGIERMLARLLGEDVKLSVALHPGPATIRADRTQLEQVLVNLAVNARDAMPRGGELSIGLESVHVAEGAEGDVGPGDYVLLTVRDTGTGIPPEIRDRLFEPFFTTKAVGEGSGLGLATVLGIVKGAGGHLGLESTVGRGTVFRIYLPAAEGEPNVSPPVPPFRRDGGEEAILLVEDDDGVRRVARRILDGAGYEVVVAANGVEALEAFERRSADFDLVVTDTIMPELGGRELARHLHRSHPDLRVLLMSGYGPDELGPGDEPGGSAFLRKPFEPGKLLHEVRAALDARRPGADPEPATRPPARGPGRLIAPSTVGD